MTGTVRFIHAADLHLGAPIRGLRNASPEWSSRLRGAIASAYERVIDAALAHAVDFVILAGDAFDTSRPSYGDHLRFFEGLGRLDDAGIPAYLVTGNHDPYTTWTHAADRLTPSSRLLGVNGPEFTLFSRNDEPLCLIGGRGYYNQSWPVGESMASGITRRGAIAALEAAHPEAAAAPFSIGIIHAGLAADMSKASVNQAELLESDIDYWACGHLHQHTVLPHETNPRIVFPGCVQGRDIKETGECGCYLVTLEKQSESTQATIEFVPTSSVVLHQIDVDVSACRTLADVSRLVQAELFSLSSGMHCDDMVTRITLTGATDLHGYLTRRTITEDLRKHLNNAYPSFYCDALIDHTQPPHDVQRMAQTSGLFPSIVTDIANEQRSREDVLINYVQSEFVKRGIAVPASLSHRIGDFNAEAESLVMDLLREDRV